MMLWLKDEGTYKLLRSLLLLVLVVTIGLLGVNQALKYTYNSQLLQTPCGLCAELNPNFTDCMITKQIINSSYNYNINISVLDGLVIP